MARAGMIGDVPVADYLADLAARTTHLTLLTGDPFIVVDPLTVEVVGAGFARVAVAWTVQTRLLVNNGAVVFTGVPDPTLVTWVAGFDAATNGSLTFAAPIDSDPFSDVGSLTIPDGELYVGFDS